ncbi:hypothetical protein [Sphingorhabdus sp.]|uniref:hypothetical protein n=1 Tax=Sphingorhabdus sp. TaxID=1902408 RepID=UPI0035931BD6
MTERRKADDLNRAQQLLLCLDGLRYSFAIVLSCHARVRSALSTFEADWQSGAPANAVIQVVADAWAMIDATQRIRLLIERAPILPKNDPEFRIFKVGTSAVEHLRHYVQHINNEITGITGQAQPLWGTISWVNETDVLMQFSLFTGNQHLQASVPGLVFDRQEMRFVRTLELNVGIHIIDLDSLARRARALDQIIADWAGTIQFSDGQKYDYRPAIAPMVMMAVRTTPIAESHWDKSQGAQSTQDP